MPDTNTAQTTIFKGDNLLGIAKQAIFKHTVFREGLPSRNHRDWIYAQTAVLPLDMSFTISIIFLFAWSGLNQKNSTEIFSAVWHLPLLFWHGVYSPWVPFPVRYMADVCMTPIKAACRCRCP